MPHLRPYAHMWLEETKAAYPAAPPRRGLAGGGAAVGPASPGAGAPHHSPDQQQHQQQHHLLHALRGTQAVSPQQPQSHQRTPVSCDLEAGCTVKSDQYASGCGFDQGSSVKSDQGFGELWF